MVSTECPLCHGKRLRRESLSVKFAGFDIADISRLPLARLADLLHPYAEATAPTLTKLEAEHPEKALVAQRIAEDLGGRLTVLLDLGLGYLSLERSTPDAFSGRTAAPATGNPSAFQSVRRRLCARRALRRTSSRGHRGAVDGARPIESLRQFAVRGRTRDRCDPACGLDRRRRARRRRTRRPCALQRSACKGSKQVEHIANPPLPVRRLHCAKPNAALAQGLAAAAWRQSQQSP